MKARQPWRKKGRGGHYVGNYITTIKGVEINLGTKNANKALERMREALATGKRNFVDDGQAAAAALEPDVGGAPVIPGVEGAGDGTPPPPAAGAPSTPTVHPDAVIPPGGTAPPQPLQLPPASSGGSDPRAEAEATNAAAAEADGSGGAEEPKPAMAPEVLKQFLMQGAGMIVELQLAMQGWLVKRQTGKDPGIIPLESPVRKIAAEAWLAQFEIWFPDIDISPWIVAVVVTGACIPVQYATATPAKQEAAAPKSAPDAGSEPMQAAA